MWQVYARLAQDIVADRRREADAARRRHQATAHRSHGRPQTLVRRILTGREAS
jgi:hypothetical protein